MAKTVHVTGVYGFLGDKFVDHFDRLGWNVEGSEYNDCEHPNALRMFRKWAYGKKLPDLVIHCASHIGGRAGIENDRSALAANLHLDSALFASLSAFPDVPIIYFSSSAAYPTTWQRKESSHRLSEGMAIRSELADADYGYAKVIGERLVERHRAIGGDVTMVRPFSGYGIGQSMDYPFPSIMHRAIDGEIPFKIWGDPTSCRDWIHVSDIVGAVDVLRQVPKDKRPTVVNLGTGIGVAMETLAQLAWNYAGNRPEDFRTEAVPGSPYGVHTRYADVSLMTRYWTPKVGLTAGVREYINAMT